MRQLKDFWNNAMAREWFRKPWRRWRVRNGWKRTPSLVLAVGPTSRWVRRERLGIHGAENNSQGGRSGCVGGSGGRKSLGNVKRTLHFCMTWKRKGGDCGSQGLEYKQCLVIRKIQVHSGSVWILWFTLEPGNQSSFRKNTNFHFFTIISNFQCWDSSSQWKYSVWWMGGDVFTDCCGPEGRDGLKLAPVGFCCDLFLVFPPETGWL